MVASKYTVDHPRHYTICYILGVQVPDMRYELPNSRRSSARKEQNRNFLVDACSNPWPPTFETFAVSLVAPGVRIHPRDETSSHNNISIPDILTLTESEFEAINQSSLDQVMSSIYSLDDEH